MPPVIGYFVFDSPGVWAETDANGQVTGYHASSIAGLKKLRGKKTKNG